jgi:FtsP/CotA-like multicopper oxidase with cupredoxin domain
MTSRHLQRRDFLRLAGLGAAAYLGSQIKIPGGFFPGISAQMGSTPTMQPMGDSTPVPAVGGAFTPDVEYDITAAEKTVQILPGTSTRVWGYEGKILQGPGETLTNLPNNSLGPIIRVKTGTKVRINFHNNLKEESVIHPHGLRVPQDCDGNPMEAIGPGQVKVYEFQVIDPAGPDWFHPHPMMTTAEEVYLGMAGLFYVWDDDEEMAVPGASTGANDIPVIIQDRIFSSNNQLVYSPSMMWGMLGNRIMVNGVLDASCSVEPRAYRLRLLNGSNARTYKLAWSNGMPLAVIGTDGGLLPEAVTRGYLMLAPGERADLWVDFSTLANQQVILKSLAFDAGMGMMGMMGSMGGMGGMGGMGRMGATGTPNSGTSNGMRGMGMMGAGTPLGTPMDILRVNVGSKATEKPVLGMLPPLTERYNATNVSNYNTPTPFTISMGMMMKWMLNGRQYEPDAVAEDEKVMAGVNLAWEFTNLSPIPHPMHIHNIHFQVVERSGSPMASYATVNQGFVESGWKDTVLVWPGERVKIAMNFGPMTGMYMYHCHILEHEQMGMMRNLMIMG